MKRWMLIVSCGIAFAACKPDLPVDPGLSGTRFFDVTGSWTYTATNVRLAGSAPPGPCEISGVTLILTQVPKAGAFSGRSTGGRMTCTGSLAFLSGPLIDYPIDDGYTLNEFTSFNIGGPDWRHEGYVVTKDSVVVDTMSGTFKLRNGGIDFQGDFRTVRRSLP